MVLAWPALAGAEEPFLCEAPAGSGPGWSWYGTEHGLPDLRLTAAEEDRERHLWIRIPHGSPPRRRSFAPAAHPCDASPPAVTVIAVIVDPFAVNGFEAEVGFIAPEQTEPPSIADVEIRPPA